MIRVSELAEKDIINTTDGRCLGMLCDIELDMQSGKIRGLLLNGGRRRRERLSIDWSEVKKIGLDTILVELRGRELPSPLFLEEHFD